jgi:hypothetical protein
MSPKQSSEVMPNSNTLKDEANDPTGRLALTERPKADCLVEREWLGLKELTRYASISERTLRSWVYSPVDPLPATKVCGKVLIRKSDFDTYLERHRIKPLEELNLDAIVQDVIKGVAHGR